MKEIQTGIDAMQFVKEIPDDLWSKINVVVWDPPYYDLGNPEHEERVNGRTKLKNPTAQWKRPHTRLMDPGHRQNILEYILDRVSDDCYIIYFHTDREQIETYSGIACEHVWVKPIHYCVAGRADRNNGEHIVIEGPVIKGKPKGRVLNRYITAKFSKEVGKDNYAPDGNNHLPRSCAKPYDLYYQLFRHLDAKTVLDPFAGYGMSIKAALHLGANVYGCDLDKTLDYNELVTISVDERYKKSVDTKLGVYF